MVFIFLTSLLLLPVVIGLGSPVVRGLSLNGRPDHNPMMRMGLCGMFGVMAGAMAGMAGNFVMPVYPVVPCAVGVVGIGMLVVNGRWIVRGVRVGDVVMVGVFLGVMAMYGSRSAERAWDTGLYHAQAVRWISESRIVPGLANLHSRLGFNSAWHMAAAVMEGPGLLGKSAFLLNTVAGVLWGMVIYDAARRAVGGEFNVGNMVLLLSLYPLTVYAIQEGQVPSLYTDLAAMMLVIAVIGLLTRPRESDAGDLAVAVQGVVLAAFAVTVKLSTMPLLPMAVGVCGLRLWRWGAGREGNPRVGNRVVMVGGVVCVVMLGMWMGRGVVLSGYPLYPSRVLGVRASWAVGEEMARVEAMRVTSWARLPMHDFREVLADNRWLGEWARKWLTTEVMVVPICWIVAGVGLHGWAQWRRRRGWTAPRAMVGRVWVGMAISVLGIAYWFVMGPDPRFGYGFLFSLGAIVLCAGLWANRPPQLPWAYRVGAIAAGVVYLLMPPQSGPMRTLPPRPTAIPQLPRVAMVERRTARGWPVLTPAKGILTWRSKLPSTPDVPDDPVLGCTVGADGVPRGFWRGGTERQAGLQPDR